MSLTIGFDPGNSTTTGILATSDDNVLSMTIPSYLGSGRLAELERVRGGLGERTLGADEYVLEYGGRSYFVGNLAMTQSDDASSARGDVQRYWSGHTLRLLLTIIGTLIPGAETMARVVTGLPVSLWTRDTMRYVQRSLLGEHTFTLNGTASQVVISECAVIMEGAGALVSYGKEGNIPQAVVDIGGRTTDLFWAQGMTPVSNRCTGMPVGVEKISDLLVSAMAQRYGRYLKPDETQAVLRSHITDAPGPAIFADGRPLSFSDTLPALVDSVGSEITSFISQKWRSADQGKVAAEAAQVLLIGGGAYYFAPHLRQLISHVVVPAEPELANARGYLAFGQRMNDADWARIRPR